MKHARRQIAHCVYGEVSEHVRRALEDLWEAGYHDGPAAQRLERLLVLLRGETPPDALMEGDG